MKKKNYEYLLKESKSHSVEVRRLRILATDVFNTLNGLNPKFMANIFHRSPYSTHKKHNLYAHGRYVKIWSLRVFGAYI